MISVITADLGNPGWEYENVLPLFKKYEENENATLVEYMNGRYHKSQRQECNQDALIVAAIRETGFKFKFDINADDELGYFLLQTTAYYDCHNLFSYDISISEFQSQSAAIQTQL